MNEKVLEIKGLYKKFGKKELLKDLNLSIYKGEIVCIIGKNGSGKTTIFNMLLKNVSINYGEISFEDKSEKNIGFFYQERNFNEPLKVGEIVKIIQSTFKKDETKLAFSEYLQNALGIKKLIKQKVGRLSGGEKQAFSLFQTLINFPKIVFLDEYSNNLDEKTLNKIKKILLEFVAKQGTTIFYASHKIEEIQNFADRILILKDKKIAREIAVKHFNAKQLEKLFDEI